MATPRPLDHDLTLYEGVTGAAEREAVLRRHLADRLGCPETALRLARDPGGKPRLVAPTPRLSFSLARRERLLLVATAWDAPVGADLERLDAGHDGLDVARNFFAPGEIAWLVSLDRAARPEGFARLWTAKEAVLKALGRGIVRGLAEPDLAPHLRPGRPLGAASVSAEAAGMGFAVSWFRASTRDGEVLASRARAAPGVRAAPGAHAPAD